jgi:hypothetical protein
MRAHGLSMDEGIVSYFLSRDILIPTLGSKVAI